MKTDNTELHAKSDDLSLLPTSHADTMSALESLIQEDDPAAAAAAAAKAKEEADAKAKADADAKLAADEESSSPPADGNLETARAAEEAETKAKEEADAKVKADADAAAKAKAGDAPAPVVEADPLDAIQLPPHTKAASSQAFGQLKATAKTQAADLRKQIADRDAAAATLKAELEAAKKVPSLDPAVAAELEDLRKFRLSKDVESDPTFKKFDDTIKSNVDKVYAKLLASGMKQESIDQIKAIGLEGVDWEPVLPKLPLTTRRFLEATLVENEKLKDQKAEALEAARENASTYLTEREAKEATILTETANGFLKTLPWTAEKAVPADATPAVKAEIEADNEFARGAMGKLKAFLSDRTPAKFAELAVGTLIAYKQKSQLDRVNARLTTVTTEAKTQVDTLTKERDKLAAELLAIKKAEKPRGQGRLATPPAPKVGIHDHRPAAEALEALAAEVAAEAND